MKVTFENAGFLKTKLAQLAKKFGLDPQVSVTVGFTQRYALYVHEVQAAHKVGQWKYLETPAKQNSRELARMMETALNSKMPMLQALMMAGARLQREAQMLTPVDTSALKASAFTCPTRDVEAVSQAAFARSEVIHAAESASKSKKNTKTRKKP